MTITLDSLTRDPNADISLDDDNASLNGWCWWNGYWRSLDSNDHTVYAYTSIGTAAPAENITMPDTDAYSGLTTDGTNLIVLRGSTALTKNIYTVTPADPPVITEVSLVAPTSSTNPRAGAIAFDVDNQQYWIAWLGDTGNGAWLQPYDTSFAEATGGFTGPTSARRITGMSWYRGHLLCAGLDETRFRIFNLANNYAEVNITTAELPADIRGLGVKDDTAFIASMIDGAQAWNIDFTDSDAVVVPDAPTGLTGTENTDGEVVLTWDDPSDDTITDHAIFRKVGNGTYTELTTTALITGQTYTDDTAVHGTGYTYKIRAINATGNSSDSNEFPFTTAVSDTTAPRPETGVPASADVTTDEVSWRVTFSEDVQNVDRTDFGIKRVGEGNFDPHTVTQISASIYDVFGTLPEPDVYHLRLRGTSDITDLSGNLRSGTGDISGSTITYTASTIDPPDAPTGLALAENNPTEVTVTWDVSTDETITDYNIYRGEVFGGPYTLLVDIVFDVTTDEGSYVDDTAEFDTTYYYVIRAENDGGESDNSTEVGITTDEEVAEDTTAPTFTIDGNDDDFDTTLELGNTYTEFEFRNKVDVDTSLDDTIIYKNSSGAVITSFDGIAPSEGSYTVEYTLTDDVDNSTTIVESLTVEDTTDPTFEVNDNTAAFATTVAYNGTYTVKAITDIVDASTTVSSITGDTAVDTSTAGDYLVTYTVTDDSANSNATSIVETVTVSAEVVTTGDELLTFTDNAEVPIPEIGQSQYTERTITIPDEYDGTISNLILDLDITHPAAWDIRVELESPEGTNIRVFSYDLPNAAWNEEPFELDDWNGEMTAGVWTLKINDGFDNVDEGTLHSWELRISTEEGLDNGTSTPVETVPDSPSSVTAIEVSGDVVLEWADASDDSITGYKIFRKTGTGAFTTLVTDTASTTLTYTDTTVSVDTSYTYKIQAINSVGNSGDSHEVTITTDPTPDTTAPTFTVEANGDDNTSNFTTTVAFNGTYTVGTIADISETGTTSAINGNTDVDTGTAGEYTVTYTVTDTAGNSTEIVETITVSEEVITDSTLTITRGTNDYDLPFEINSSNGMCWFNGYWRICDFTDDIVYALNSSFGRVSSEDITNIPSGGSMLGLTRTATHLLLLFNSTPNNYVRMYDTDNNFVMQFTLTGFPSNAQFPLSISYDETNNIILVGMTGTFGNPGHIGAFTIPTIVTGTTPSTALISSASFDLTNDQQRPSSMVWYEGYVITADDVDDRFYVYKLSDQSFVSSINPTGVSPSVQGLGIRDGSLYLVDRTDNAVDEWIVNITGAEEDTTAPTFEVDGNTTDFATTVVYDETYTVGIISDISETGTISVITGDTNVDTSTAGEYTVTYTVTDEAGNSSEIVETVTVSAEIDTTAPTFQVGDNTTDFATTVAFEGTYTVGVISDISETGTTSTITGNNDVDTSTSGEYTVTYTVTDTAGNAGEIIETVTVSPEVIVPDTTAPTFTVKTNSADFDITIELGDCI